MLPTGHVADRNRRAFSLLEMLVVVGVMAIMLSLIAPAVAGFQNTAGRRGAVNVVMNAMEQARVAALESGQTVYVAFADKNFPIDDMKQSAFIIFRDATDDEIASNPGQPYIVLKTWTRLPRGVFFRDTTGTIFDSGSALTFSQLDKSLPSRFADVTKLPAVGFNSSGSVESPSGGTLCLFIEDRQTASSGSLFERISVARYTGRVQLDVTATSG